MVYSCTCTNWQVCTNLPSCKIIEIHNKAPIELHALVTQMQISSHIHPLKEIFQIYKSNYNALVVVTWQMFTGLSVR